MIDYTRITVSQNGKYLFATEEGQLAREKDAKRVYQLLKEKFPESEGYHVRVIVWKSTGSTPEWAIED